MILLLLSISQCSDKTIKKWHREKKEVELSISQCSDKTEKLEGTSFNDLIFLSHNVQTKPVVFRDIMNKIELSISQCSDKTSITAQSKKQVLILSISQCSDKTQKLKLWF